MAIKTELEPRQICFVTWWSSCSSASQLTDWLRAPDHTGVVWGLYTCCWSSLNISVPRLQEAHFETAHMWPSGYESVPPQFRPSLKTCFILVFIHPPAICSLRLKKKKKKGWTSWTVIQQPHAFSEQFSHYFSIFSIFAKAADESLHCAMNAMAQHRIVLHLNVLPSSSILHHKTQ